LTYLDLHSHSVASDDSRATVEQYVKWVKVLRRKGHQINGFVLTEHRQFDAENDYSYMQAESDVQILKGSELDTDCGHFLVYGVGEALLKEVNFAEVGLNAQHLIKCAESLGAIAIPAHPGRFGVGLCEYVENTDFTNLQVVEHLNGSNRPGEQERAESLMLINGYSGTGGSDAHVVSAIGSCMTLFDDDIGDEIDLVAALKSRKFKAVLLKEALLE